MEKVSARPNLNSLYRLYHYTDEDGKEVVTYDTLDKVKEVLVKLLQTHDAESLLVSKDVSVAFEPKFSKTTDDGQDEAEKDVELIFNSILSQLENNE